MSSNNAPEDGSAAPGPSFSEPTPADQRPRPANEQPPPANERPTPAAAPGQGRPYSTGPQPTTPYAPPSAPQPTTPYAPLSTTPYAPPSAPPPGLYQQQPQHQQPQYQPAQYQPAQYQPAQYQPQPYPSQPYPAPAYPQPGHPQPGYPQPGYAQPSYANLAPTGYRPPGVPYPSQRRIRRKPLLAAIVALVVAIGLGAVAVQQYQASRTPTQVVTRYFAALVDDKAADALSFAATPPHGRYLTSAVLAQQLKIGRISGVRVDGVTEDGDQARASVEYNLGLSQGSRLVHDQVSLVKRGSAWKLSSVAPSAELGVKSFGADRVLLAGGALPSSPVALFPGALPLTTDSAAVIVQDQPNVRLADDGQGIELTVALTSAAQTKISQTLRAALGSCFSGKSTDPSCPGGSEERQVPDSLRGTVAPITSEVTIQLDGTGGGEVELTGAVTVKGSWKVWDFNNQAVPKSGETNVAIHAVTSVADPSKLFWRS